jgi:FlaG/FlaF family flagellin (archaellin)
VRLNNKITINDKIAVSTVIGVILMVAITVAVAGTIYFYISGFSGEPVQKASSLSMNVYSRDDLNNVTIWLVSGLSGAAVKDDSYNTLLIFENGSKDAGATIIKQEVIQTGYANAGDTFTVTASQDGFFVFLVTDTVTEESLFKSALSKY